MSSCRLRFFSPSPEQASEREREKERALLAPGQITQSISAESRREREDGWRREKRERREEKGQDVQRDRGEEEETELLQT